LRTSAAQTLGAARRRLQPVAGGGWAALSPTEAEVAERILRGQEVQEIAEALVVSPYTVKVHVSRVLCAFGVASRIGLLAAVRRPAGALPTPSLTPRQQEVARLVAEGRSNQQIAEALAVSARTVEKHVADIGSRWATTTRFALARTWWASDYS
ncbi:MAG: helix-turn-helix transcriptional regulator, partial [Nocardioides sp.]|uniref:response regulator transcription factor n=1 Tax=Nocardioides sp. TaxID=35761 RepID=UPI0039E4BC88